MKVVLGLLSIFVGQTNAGFFNNLFYTASETMTVEDLQAEFPDVALETIMRFHSVFGLESGDKLGDYLDWKTKHTLTWDQGALDDNTRWQLLVEQSILYLNETAPHLITDALIENPPKFPVAYATNFTDNEGNMIFQLLPKRMRLDRLITAPVELYTDVLAAYLDIELEGSEKATLMLDFRPGRGWDNTPYKK